MIFKNKNKFTIELGMRHAHKYINWVSHLIHDNDDSSDGGDNDDSTNNKWLFIQYSSITRYTVNWMNNQYNLSVPIQVATFQRTIFVLSFLYLFTPEQRDGKRNALFLFCIFKAVLLHQEIESSLESGDREKQRQWNNNNNNDENDDDEKNCKEIVVYTQPMYTHTQYFYIE